MKYNININQKELSKTNLDLVDCAILDYIRIMCASQNDKIIKKRIDGYTWISYSRIMEDMPLLRIKSKGAISKRIKSIKEAGFIDVKTKNQMIHVKPTAKMDMLEFETDDDRCQEETEPLPKRNTTVLQKKLIIILLMIILLIIR